jgi:hypothetical protein
MNMICYRLYVWNFHGFFNVVELSLVSNNMFGCARVKIPSNIKVDYKKSQFFKRFNLAKMFTLTKRMFTLIKGMEHERHMILWVDFFD